MGTDSLKELYRKYTGIEAGDVCELPFSGSNRRYFRLSGGGGSLIGVNGTSEAENRAFIYLARHFRRKGLPVPEIYCQTDDFLYYLQEDLGDVLLFEAIEKGRNSRVFDDRERLLLRKTIALLPAIQALGAHELDFGRCYPQAEFDSRSVMWDLNYFKYCFLKPSGLDFPEDKLEDDFRSMCAILLEDSSDTFFYRDFQSRNVMIRNNEPWFIDFQGGRRGPVYYDVASFLWQARANFTDELRNELLSEYIASLNRFIPAVEESFRRKLRHFVLFRILQTLGAYGFRGYFEKKPHFIHSVPYAIENLSRLLRDGFAEYPHLSRILHELVNLSQFADPQRNRVLEVKIISFAYKKGIPDDPAGNGGGFVFDCRGINNPGKYEWYHHFTGLDQPVISFLEDDGEIIPFLDNVYQLVDPTIKRYIDRRFTSLMVCFGCTGGRHRSVYSAQRLAERLHSAYGVKIHLIHREQNIEQIFQPAL
ncbi:MAG: phosphotransferase [Tannerellaceae bacterium]|jgi:aminoglycoside/choline kinase family phosphotransferase|nr:phosphotransferase [Tannerellaceae bacterium]